MVENLSCKNGIVSWNNIVLKIDTAFLALESNGIIQVKCGENYIEKEVLFYNENGITILKYNLVSKVVYDKNREIKLSELEQALPYNGEVVILCNKNKVLRVSADKKIIIESPCGYVFDYLTIENNNLIAVCNGDKKHSDEFGRITKKFLLDEVNSCFLDKGLGY